MRTKSPDGINASDDQTMVSCAVRWIYTLSIACLPLAIGQSSHWKYIPFAILISTGIYLLSHTIAIRQQYSQARSILYAVSSFVLVPTVNVAWHGSPYANLGLYPQILVFLATSAVFFLPVHRTAIWLAFSATGAFYGGIAWYQIYVDGQPRAYGLNGGPWAAIEFGMFLFALALLTLNQILSARTARWARLFHAICFAITVYGGVLTESRGPILSFPIMVVVLCLLHFKQIQGWQVALRRILLSCALGFIVMIALQPLILTRFFAIADEVQSYNPEHNATGAIRERIEMWRASLKAVQAHPLIGVGPNNFGRYIQQQVDQGALNPSIRRYKHPHNEDLEVAATAGIPGLLALLSLFIVSLRYFLRHSFHDDQERTTVARSGVVLVGLYMLCALSDNVFYRAMPHSLYFFLILGFAMWVNASHSFVSWQKSTS